MDNGTSAGNGHQLWELTDAIRERKNFVEALPSEQILGCRGCCQIGRRFVLEANRMENSR